MKEILIYVNHLSLGLRVDELPNPGDKIKVTEDNLFFNGEAVIKDNIIGSEVTVGNRIELKEEDLSEVALMFINYIAGLRNSKQLKNLDEIYLKQNIEIDASLANDPDYQAYMALKEGGKLEGYKPGTWIAILNGQIYFSHIKKDKLKETISAMTDESCFITQVNIEKEVVDMGGAYFGMASLD